MMLKTSFQKFRKRSHSLNCSNFAIIEIIMVGTNSLKRFLKKLQVQRNTKIKKKRNGVITLPWRLRLQQNPDHKKLKSLNNAVVVIFSIIFTHGDLVNAQTWEVRLPKNPVEPS